MKYEEIIQRFDIVRNSNDKCMCRCPAHNDRIEMCIRDRNYLI